MMLFALLKKDFLIVKKYVLIMLVVIALIPPVMRWRTPEFTGVFGFILSVIFGVFMLLQYVSLLPFTFELLAPLKLLLKFFALCAYETILDVPTPEPCFPK